MSDAAKKGTERISLAEYRALLGRTAPESSSGRVSAAKFQQTASEAAIQETICAWLQAHHIPFSVTDASRSFGPDGEPRRSKVRAGWPDISGVIPRTGRAFFIETKSATGRLRAEQKRVIAHLRAAGALVIVARSMDEVIRSFGQASPISRENNGHSIKCDRDAGNGTPEQLQALG